MPSNPPERRQQFLNLRSDPQGHGSLRPSFSSSSLSPCTTRTPRLTRVSDGNPLRRLLVRSKAGHLFVLIVFIHSDLLCWLILICKVEDLNPSTSCPLFTVRGLEGRCGNTSHKMDPATGLATCIIRFTRAARLSATLESERNSPRGTAPRTYRFADGPVHLLRRGRIWRAIRSSRRSRNSPVNSPSSRRASKGILPSRFSSEDWGDQWERSSTLEGIY